MSRSRKAPPEPVTPLDHALAFLVESGFAIPEPGDEYALTPDGRDFMLWSLWLGSGCPGLPAEPVTEEVSA